MSHPARLGVVLLSGLLLVAAGGMAMAQEPSNSSPPGPDAPITSPPEVPGEPIEPVDGATPVDPQPGLIDLREQAWDHVTVGPDGRTLTIYFWNGVPECYGLGGVEVTVQNGTLDISLVVGTVPGAEICIEIAQLYSTQVVLDQPIITGGTGIEG